jgi:hypothetical protein
MKLRRVTAVFVAAISALSVAVVAATTSVGVARVQAAAPVEALLLGDSVMNGIGQHYSLSAQAALANHHTYILDAAGCRRLLTTSCSIQGGTPPTTGIYELRHMAGLYNRVLVVGAGYDDDTDGPVGVAAAVDEYMAVAKSQSVPWVIWLTYREADTPFFKARFHANNVMLQGKLKKYPNLRLADWAKVSATMPASWFSKDGIHLGGQSALAMANLIVSTIDALPPLDRCNSRAWVGSAPSTAATVTLQSTGGMHLLDHPVRIADTRTGYGALGARHELVVPVGGRAGVPSTAVGAVVTVTADHPCLATSIRVYACNGAPPPANAFLLDAAAKVSVSNSTMVRLGGGRLCVYTTAASEIQVDLTGWIGASGARTAPVDGPRLVDTRVGAAETTKVPHHRLQAAQRLTIDLRNSSPGIGTGAGVNGVTVGLTLIKPSAAGPVAVLPGACTTTLPPVITAQAIAGHDSSASTSVRTISGKICVITSVALDLAVDLQAVHRTSGEWITVKGSPVVIDSRPIVVSPARRFLVRFVAPAAVKGVVVNLLAVHPAASTRVTIAACSATQRPSPQLVTMAARTAGVRVVVPADHGPLCVTVSTGTAIVAQIEGYLS